jgi:hypothetical protein
METFCLRKLPNRATSMTAMTDSHKSFDLLLHQTKIQSRGKRAHSLLVNVNQHVQKTLRTAEKDNPNVDTLTTFYQGHNADNGVII